MNRPSSQIEGEGKDKKKNKPEKAFYVGSDEEDLGEVVARDKTNKYRREGEKKPERKSSKTFAEDHSEYRAKNIEKAKPTSYDIL